MIEEQNIKEPHTPTFLQGAICRLFHPIETIQNCSFIDKVSGKSVGKFRCKKCEVEYLANSKRDIFRCEINK